MGIYANFLRAPLSYAQQMADEAQAATQQALDAEQKAKRDQIIRQARGFVAMFAAV